MLSPLQRLNRKCGSRWSRLCFYTRESSTSSCRTRCNNITVRTLNTIVEHTVDTKMSIVRTAFELRKAKHQEFSMGFSKHSVFSFILFSCNLKFIDGILSLRHSFQLSFFAFDSCKFHGCKMSKHEQKNKFRSSV